MFTTDKQHTVYRDVLNYDTFGWRVGNLYSQ